MHKTVFSAGSSFISIASSCNIESCTLLIARMSFQTKEAAYDPLASDEKRFSQSSDGAEDQEDNMGLLGRVRKTPFRSSSWARAGGKVVAAVNTILLLSIIVILLVSHRYEHQCSESECAAKTSYYCRWYLIS